MATESNLIQLFQEPNLESSKLNDCFINNLPCELLFYIFNNFFDLIDILEIRLVCKRWRTIIQNHFKLKKLNIVRVYEYDYQSRNYGWLGGEAYNSKFKLYLYKDETSNYLKSDLFKSILFINLKYLNLNYKLNDKFNFDIFHYFKQLIQLEFYYLVLRDNKKRLNLSNLTTFAIYNLELEKNSLLEINCDQLQNLYLSGYKSLNKIKINHPNTIKNLFLHTSNDDLNDLIIFNNLEILNCYINREDEINLELFTNLKELNLYDGYYSISESDKLICKQLLKKSKKLNLQIYLNDIKLVNNNQIDQLDSNTLIEELNDNFKSSIRSFNKDISLYQSDKNDCIFSKFIDKVLKDDNLEIKFKYIHDVHLDQIPCNDNFIYSLSKFYNLRKLYLYYLPLDQNFYDLLPDCCPFLINLSIFSRKKINLENLIRKLNYLSCFNTNNYLELDFVINHFKKNKNIHLILFRNQDREYKIFKKGQNQFKFEWDYVLMKRNSGDNIPIENLKSRLL